jgi:hypothetical protein
MASRVIWRTDGLRQYGNQLPSISISSSHALICQRGSSDAFPGSLRDTLLRLAETPRQYIPKWAGRILEELTRNLESNRKLARRKLRSDRPNGTALSGSRDHGIHPPVLSLSLIDSHPFGLSDVPWKQPPWPEL